MSKYILQFPEAIKHLEDNNLWLDAVTLLHDQWKKNPMDEHNLVCLIMEAWYAIVELDYWYHNPFKHTDNKVERQKIYDVMHEATTFGFMHHSDSVIFNMYIGYAVSVTPLNFEDFIDIGAWRNTGMVMIHKAFLQDNADRLTRLFYYASIDHNCEEYKSSSREFWSTMSFPDWGNSAIQRYFFDMFDGKKSQD